MKKLLSFARVALVPVILWWLFASGKIDPAPLYDQAVGEGRTLVPWFACMALIFTSLLLLAYRWQQMLRLQKIRISIMDSLSATVQGNFFSIFLPGTAGGDLVKIAYITRSLPRRRMSAVLATFYDRLVGIVSLLLVVSLLSGTYLALEKGHISFQKPREWQMLMLLAFLGLIVCCGLLAGLAFLVRTGRVERFLAKRSAWAGFDDFSETLHGLFRNKGRVLWLMGVSCANHLINVLVFVAVGMALGIPLGPMAQMMISALGALSNLLPVTPGGIGITESAYYYLFLLAGSDAGGTLGLIARVLNYLVFLLFGLPFFMVRGGRLDALTE